MLPPPPWTTEIVARLEPLLPAVTAGPGTCRHCWDLIPPGYRTCRRCRTAAGAPMLVPITLSVSGGPMHAALRGYKDAQQYEVRERHTRELTALLWRFLAAHEACVAAAAEVEHFDVVTAVPSSTPVRDELRPRLRHIVGEACGWTTERSQRVLRASGRPASERAEDPRRFYAQADADIVGANVLLVDDTLVTGARLRSAVAALDQAGAAATAVVVLGRHVSASHADNARRIDELPRLDMRRCALSYSRERSCSCATQTATSLG